MDKTLGAAVAAEATRRKAAGTSYSEQARAAGVSWDLLRDVVRGKSLSPKPQHARALAAYYGLNLDDFAEYRGFAEAAAPLTARPKRQPLNVPVFRLEENGHLEVSGTFDRAGLEKLIERLQLFVKALE